MFNFYAAHGSLTNTLVDVITVVGFVGAAIALTLGIVLGTLISRDPSRFRARDAFLPLLACFSLVAVMIMFTAVHDGNPQGLAIGFLGLVVLACTNVYLWQSGLLKAADPNHDVIVALEAVLGAYDPHTSAHSSQVERLTAGVAIRLGLSLEEQRHVASVAMLHDLGKIGISHELLYKPGPLSPEETNTMRQHPVIGCDILTRIPGLDEIATAVRHEHERWDGQGYPDGIAGEEIPIASRIVFVCDAYDAMVSDRPYRTRTTSRAARLELAANSGSQFDPRIVDALLEELSEIEMPDRWQAKVPVSSRAS